MIKNEEIMSTEMLVGFYFETETRSFELNIMSYIFFISVTYSAYSEIIVKGLMLLV